LEYCRHQNNEIANRETTNLIISIHLELNLVILPVLLLLPAITKHEDAKRSSRNPKRAQRPNATNSDSQIND
jgi:hypothetical protein